MASTVNPDMEVIKEIPGYKVILKAVLKSQIQQLVESLASHTDEETVILTASVADGTLSHLGSDSGKTFLTDHEDIKSQFLGHCLKRSHEKRREKEREEEEARIMQQMQQSRPHPIGPPMMGVGMPHMTPPPRMLPAPRLRGPSPRHQPYGRTDNHPARINTSQRTSTPKTSTSTVVKVEKDDSGDFGVNNSNISAGNTSGQSSPKVDNSAGQNESSVNEQSELGQDIPGSEQLSLGADLSKLVDETSSQIDSETASTSLAEAGAMNIKVEALNDSDMELEIVGVEPGHVPESVDWGPNTSQEQDWSGMQDSQQYNTTSKEANKKHPIEEEQHINEDHPIEEEHRVNEDQTIDKEQTIDVEHPIEEGDPIVEGQSFDEDVNESGEDHPFDEKHDAGTRDGGVLTAEVEDETGRFKCNLCQRTYLYKVSLQRHIKTHTIDKKLFCSLCTKHFPTEADLQLHNTEKHKSRYLCTICGKVLSTNYNLTEHMNHLHSDSQDAQYVCQFENCGKRFNRLIALEDHMNLHTNTTPHVCQHCQKGFASRYRKNEHERFCGRKVDCKCETCSAIFTDKRALMRHHQSQHENKRYICSCGRVYAYYSSLLKHKKAKNH